MTMSYIAFVKFSQIHIVVTFNSTPVWLEPGAQMYTLTRLEITQRLLQ